MKDNYTSNVVTNNWARNIWLTLGLRLKKISTEINYTVNPSSDLSLFLLNKISIVLGLSV